MQTALDEARAFAADILYATPQMIDALTLAAAASHLMDQWDTVPRLLFTSDEGESGKTTAMDVFGYLANKTWNATRATSYALRSKFTEPEPPTILMDEISRIFGMSGLNGRQTETAVLAQDGYRRKATISMSVNRMALDMPAFCMLAMAGLKNAVPGDVRTRCITFPMKKIPENVWLPLNSEDPDTEALAMQVRDALHQQIRALGKTVKELKRSWRPPHPKMKARKAQIWSPLWLVAKAVGGDWPDRCLDAFRALALDAAEKPVLTPKQQMLRDVAMAFIDSGKEALPNREIRSYLLNLADSPLWSRLSDDGLAKQMAQALGPHHNITFAQGRARGYYARPIVDAWRKLEVELERTTTEEQPPNQYEGFFDDPVVEAEIVEDLDDDPSNVQPVQPVQPESVPHAWPMGPPPPIPIEQLV